MASELNFQTAKYFSEKLLAIEMKKMNLTMNKPVYLGLSIFEISKTALCNYWYDYVKPKYGPMAKLCYMDTDSFIIHVKSKDIYTDLAGGVK